MSLRLATFNVENLVHRFDFSGFRGRLNEDRTLASSGIRTAADTCFWSRPAPSPFPPGQEVERFPRLGWDRPKACGHCPVAIAIALDLA